MEWSFILYIFHIELDVWRKPIRTGLGSAQIGAMSPCRASRLFAARYLDCAAELARLLFERCIGFAQVASEGAQFATEVSDFVDRLWFFCAALVGPIANLNSAPFPESKARASCGMETAIAAIPTNLRTLWPMMFMIESSQRMVVPQRAV